MRIRTVRTFKKNHKISLDEWLQIFDEIRYTPSSFDLQPWRFVVIESEEAKQKLKTIIHRGNLFQLETSSATVLVCGVLDKHNLSDYIYNQKFLNKEIDFTNKEITINKIKQHYGKMSLDKVKNEICLECGLISFNFIITLQKFGYSSCFMGGFCFEKINYLFNIPLNYQPIILISVGKSDINLTQNATKFKLDVKEIVSFL
ncbi:MAG: nitroreductase family protein [Phytoplasma sp.]|uniref:nitroreductase family protein n=1 Tax=Phytoplasma sp. TaxID=2155 RepID=UPI002B4077C9|nr:nitroreductase family protein [Phytoplasma sp.]WRH06866.1 MAG: nitroreductase family protein [Phytoplasma sp.]